MNLSYFKEANKRIILTLRWGQREEVFRLRHLNFELSILHQNNESLFESVILK